MLPNGSAIKQKSSSLSLSSRSRLSSRSLCALHCLCFKVGPFVWRPTLASSSLACTWAASSERLRFAQCQVRLDEKKVLRFFCCCCCSSFWLAMSPTMRMKLRGLPQAAHQRAAISAEARKESGETLALLAWPTRVGRKFAFQFIFERIAGRPPGGAACGSLRCGGSRATSGFRAGRASEQCATFGPFRRANQSEREKERKEHAVSRVESGWLAVRLVLDLCDGGGGCTQAGC